MDSQLNKFDQTAGHSNKTHVHAWDQHRVNETLSENTIFFFIRNKHKCDINFNFLEKLHTAVA